MLEGIVHALSRVEVRAVSRALSVEIDTCSTSDSKLRDGGEVTLDNALKDDLAISEDNGVETFEGSLVGKATRTRMNVGSPDSGDDLTVGGVRGREVRLIARTRGVVRRRLGVEGIRVKEDWVTEGSGVTKLPASLSNIIRGDEPIDRAHLLKGDLGRSCSCRSIGSRDASRVAELKGGTDETSRRASTKLEGSGVAGVNVEGGEVRNTTNILILAGTTSDNKLRRTSPLRLPVTLE